MTRTRGNVEAEFSLKNFKQAYVSNYKWAMEQLDESALRLAIDFVKTANHIFVGGNGGSAAISNHLCCDFMKGTKHKKHSPIRVTSLSCNVPIITAIANDIGYDQTLAFQLEELLQDGDVVILISSSGNSPNIIEAAKVAKSKGSIIIGITGFKGGKLAEISDVSLHIPYGNYGVVEDCHQSIMHIISQYISHERSI